MSHDSSIIKIHTNLSSELSDHELAEVINVNSICRICGSQTDKLLGIFSDDCMANEIPSKLNVYLPIQISEEDALPLQLCWSCASTVLTWHDLVVTCAEVDKKLRSYHVVIAEKQPSSTNENEIHTEESSSTMVLSSLGESPQPLSDSTHYVNNLLEKYTEEITLATGGSNSVQSLPRNECIKEFDVEKSPVTHKEESLHEQDKVDEDYFDSVCTKVIEEAPEQFQFGCLYCSNVFETEIDIKNHIQIDHPDVDIKNEHGNLLEILPVSKYTRRCAEIENQEVRRQLSKERIRKNNKIDLEMVNAARVVVGDKVYYNCKICDKSLHSPYTYAWHIRIHTGERPFVCDLCGKQFRVSQGLVRHLKETHARIKKFSCDLCSRYFATKRNVEEHRRIHTNERPYVCDLCGKSFKQKASLFVHNRSHTNSFPFECNHCSAAFRTKPLLNNHLTKHTGEKPYPCEECGRQFRIKYELKRHKLIHSNEKPFTCTLCQTNFRQKRYLRNHLRFNHLGYSLEDTPEGTVIVITESSQS